MAVCLFGLHKNLEGKQPGTDHLFARIFDRDFLEFLLFILLAQMFARGNATRENAITMITRTEDE